MILSVYLFYPILLAKTFQLGAADTQALIQRTLLMMGIATILQLIFGHRITVFEAIAAYWFGIYMLISQSVLARGGSVETALGQITFVVMLTGIIILMLAWTRTVDYMQKLFTPNILGVTLLLITVQISKNIVLGMLGFEEGLINPTISLFSFSLFLLTLLISLRGGKMKSYVALLGLLFGSLAYTVFGFPQLPVQTDGILALPAIWDFGKPIYNFELIPQAFFVAMIYYSNSIASVRGVAGLLDVDIEKRKFRRSGIVGGLIHLLSGMLAVMPMVPAATSIGFIKTTGVGSRRALLAGGIFLVLMGIVSPLGAFFASVPYVVAYSVALSVFMRMASMGFTYCFESGLSERSLLLTGTALTVGCGFMFIPPGAFSSIPLLGSTLENGIFIGIITALIMEHWVLVEEDIKTG
ncbi:purine/pyrimidine permease [Clostridia bacterium]|nr:purine/pyrimidine permease [Clostridia bacterium]